MPETEPLTPEERQEAERLCAETDHLWKATHYGSAYCYWCGAPWPRVTDLPTTGCLTFAAKVEKFLTRPTDYERSALVKVLTRAGEHVALLPRALATIAALERQRDEASRMKAVDDAFYRHTVAQRDGAWREVETLKAKVAALEQELQRERDRQMGDIIVKAGLR